MKANIGMNERVIRMYLGVAIASVFIYSNSVWALIGIPVFISGIAGICPLYSIIGFSTLEKEKC
jgi:hypothetical protein